MIFKWLREVYILSFLPYTFMVVIKDVHFGNEWHHKHSLYIFYSP